MQRLNVTAFTSRENGTAPQKQWPRMSGQNTVRSFSSYRRKKQHTSHLGAKIGICVSACLLVFAVQLVDTPFAKSVTQQVLEASDNKTDMDEMLGKLQFVELPSALEVFAPENDKFALPVDGSVAVMQVGQTMARWEGAANAAVLAPGKGEVRAVGEDPILGRYVRIAHADEVETIYYGFEQVRVEVGQPVRKQDTLGLLGQEGVLSLSVLRSGRPQQPEEYLDISYQA